MTVLFLLLVSFCVASDFESELCDACYENNVIQFDDNYIPTRCGMNQTCCNSSCKICVDEGGFCIQIACDCDDDPNVITPINDTDPNTEGEICDLCWNDKLVEFGSDYVPKRCGNNETCCNPSCGVCVPPGGFCTEQACLCDNSTDIIPPPDDNNSTNNRFTLITSILLYLQIFYIFVL